MIDINTLLCNSAVEGNLEKVIELIDQGANIHHDNDYPIHVSTEKGHIEILKYFLPLIGDNEKCITDIIIISIQNNHVSIIALLKQVVPRCSEFLFKIIIDPQYFHLNVTIFLTDNNLFGKGHPFTLAAGNGQIHVVKYLIRKGVDKSFYKMALERGVANGHFKISKYLMKKGSKVIDNYNSVLDVAVKSGNLKMIKYLVKHSVSNNKPIYDTRPLHRAVEIERTDIVEYLIKEIYLHSHYEYSLECASECNMWDFYRSISLGKKSINSDLDLLNFASFNNNEAVEHLLSLYNKDELKKLTRKINQDKIISYLLKTDLCKYHPIIDIMREWGIDVYDIVEHEGVY